MGRGAWAAQAPVGAGWVGPVRKSAQLSVLMVDFPFFPTGGLSSPAEPDSGPYW